MAESGLSETIAVTLLEMGLPVQIPEDLPRAEIMRAMRVDKKKASGIVRFALPVKIGEVRTGVEVEDLNLVFTEV